MKNRTLALLATASLGLAAFQANAQPLVTEITAGYESEYVFRGIELARESLQADVNLSYRDFYAGIWTNEALRSRESSEINFYAGYEYAVTNELTADFGATVYYYHDAKDTTEAYLGFSWDALLTPAVYFFYDFDLKTFTAEAQLTKAFPLTDTSDIELGLDMGWSNERRGDDYYYYGFRADYVYRFTDNVRASIGVRSAGNNNNMGPGGREGNAWYGASFNAAF